MAKPMTSEQIETELQATVLESAGGQPIALARAAFTLGQDNGQAIMLERAESILGQLVEREQSFALGRAVAQIIAWAALVKGRSWAPQSTACLLFAGEEGAIDPESPGAGAVRFCHGADASEAIIVAATWCTEHTKNSAPKVHDTLPAPADESELAELAENRATADAWEKTHGDTGAFGGSDI